MGLGTNKLLGWVRQQEVRERRQQMLVCVSTEAKRVLGKGRVEGMEGKMSHRHGGREL